jgi:polyisoprenoid-binding protein YceI
MAGAGKAAVWVRGALLALALGGALRPAPAPAAQLFQLDQRYGSIAFTVSNLGLFRSRGAFERFVGRLTIDRDDPAATHIAVTVAADSVHTPWDQETEMLRSPDFFDVARYPEIHFESREVSPQGPNRYVIRGALTLRGQTRPVDLAAKLVHAARDPAGQQIDDFVVTGHVSRRAFGMTADPLFIADKVEIAIHARIILGPPQGG